MNSTQLTNKFNQIVNTNSRLYDLCIEAINKAETSPKDSLAAQSKAAKEIRTFVNEESLTDQEKFLISDLEKATTLSDDMASANLDYLYNLCYRFGKDAPDKQAEANNNYEYVEHDETEGKVVYYEEIKETYIENSTRRSHMFLIPVMVVVTILTIIAVTVATYYGVSPTIQP